MVASVKIVECKTYSPKHFQVDAVLHRVIHVVEMNKSNSRDEQLLPGCCTNAVGEEKIAQAGVMVHDEGYSDGDETNGSRGSGALLN